MSDVSELIDSLGCGVGCLDDNLTNVLKPFILPNELVMLLGRCKNQQIGYYNITQIDEGMRFWHFARNNLNDMPWPKSWLLIASADPWAIIAALPKSEGEPVSILKMAIGNGDSKAYLAFSDLRSFLMYCHEWECLMVEDESKAANSDLLLLKYSPNVYLDDVQKDAFSSNGVRNVFDLFDPETVPDEWL